MMLHRLRVLAVAASILWLASGCERPIQTFTPHEGDFSVALPGTPSISFKNQGGNATSPPKLIRDYEVRGAKVSQGVAVLERIGDQTAAWEDPARQTEAAIRAMTRDGGQVLANRTVTRDGVQGQEILVDTPPNDTATAERTLCQLFQVGPSLYIVTYNAQADSYSDSKARAFVDSFRLLRRHRGSATEPDMAVGNALGSAPADPSPSQARLPQPGGGKPPSSTTATGIVPAPVAVAPAPVFRPTLPPRPSFRPPIDAPGSGMANNGPPTEASPGTGSVPRPSAPPGFGGFGSGRNVGQDTEFAGGNAAGSFRFAEADRPMLGLDFTLGEWADEPCLGLVRPVYDRGSRPGLGTRMIAPEGYAVGGIEVQTRRFVDAARLVYFRLGNDGKLDPADRRTSDWFGHPNPDAKQTALGGDGRRVLGIHCRQGAILDGLALVMEAKNP